MSLGGVNFTNGIVRIRIRDVLGIISNIKLKMEIIIIIVVTIIIVIRLLSLQLINKKLLLIIYNTTD